MGTDVAMPSSMLQALRALAVGLTLFVVPETAFAEGDEPAQPPPGANPVLDAWVFDLQIPFPISSFGLSPRVRYTRRFQSEHQVLSGKSVNFAVGWLGKSWRAWRTSRIDDEGVLRWRIGSEMALFWGEARDHRTMCDTPLREKFTLRTTLVAFNGLVGLGWQPQGWPFRLGVDVGCGPTLAVAKFGHIFESGVTYSAHCAESAIAARTEQRGRDTRWNLGARWGIEISSADWVFYGGRPTTYGGGAFVRLDCYQSLSKMRLQFRNGRSAATFDPTIFHLTFGWRIALRA